MSFSYIPILISAISIARNEESGIASGLVITTYQIGSALGLAVIVSVSTLYSKFLVNIGTNMLEVLNEGFHLAFIGAAIISAIAAIILSRISNLCCKVTFAHIIQQSLDQIWNFFP